MIRFHQSVLKHVDGAPPSPEGWGDCTRACFASMLELDPALLPNPHGENFRDWGLEWSKALAPFGVKPVWVWDMASWWELGFPGYWMATVKLRPDERIAEDAEHHSVVMLCDQLAHDPTPDSLLLERDFTSDIVHATMLVPINPARGVVR